MTAPEQKTEMPWDQSEFEKLKATWSPERIAEDDKRLQEIFNLAAASPTLKQALDWAKAHGIKFFIDRTAKNCGGYYQPGTGVFAIAEQYADPSAFAVETLTHEIRHAWQDYHGLIPRGLHAPAATPDFAEYFIQLSLIEADAWSFGKRAADELNMAPRIAHMKRNNQPVPASLLPPESAALAKEFLSWFSCFWVTKFYGDAASKYYGKANGIYDGLLPVLNCEFSSKTPPLGTGIDIANIENVIRLGEGFSGKNYLAKLPRDMLPKKILRPSLAMSFYGAANDDQKKLTAELRKCALRKKLSVSRG